MDAISYEAAPPAAAAATTARAAAAAEVAVTLIESDAQASA